MGLFYLLCVTYSDLFSFVIMLCAVITLVINITRKKKRPRSGKLRRYFLTLILSAARLHLVIDSLVKYIICQSTLNFNPKLPIISHPARLK